MMILPNGNGGMMVFPTADSPPDRYSGRYLTANDLYVDVTYHTSNKTLADQLEAQLLKDMSWRLVPEGTGSTSVWAELGGIWGLAIMAAVVIPVLAFLLGLGANMADWGGYNAPETWAKYAIRAEVYALPALAIIWSIAVVFSHWSQKKHG